MDVFCRETGASHNLDAIMRKKHAEILKQYLSKLEFMPKRTFQLNSDLNYSPKLVTNWLKFVGRAKIGVYEQGGLQS